MVAVQNLHGPALWGFFFACSPILSADVTGLCVDRSHHVFHLCHPSTEALPHDRDQGQPEEENYAYARAISEEIEPFVQFIEDTDPSEIVDQTLAKLRDRVSIRTMLTASALAVTQSSDLPPGHHGGPLRPLVELHAVYHITKRLPGDDRFLPVLQHVGCLTNTAEGLANHAALRRSGGLLLPGQYPGSAGLRHHQSVSIQADGQRYSAGDGGAL
jgi:hypothetical protein